MLIHPTPGRLVWPAAMIVWGPGFTTAGHRHHCVQLIMAMRGTLLIRGNSDDPWMRCGAALVRPDAAHEVDAQDTTVLIGFVDSESELGAALSERIEGGISCVSESQVARWRLALGRMPTEARVERWVRTELLHRRRPVRIHPGVSLVLKYLREKLGISHDFSLKTWLRFLACRPRASCTFSPSRRELLSALYSLAPSAAGLLRFDGGRQCHRRCSQCRLF